MNRVNSVRVESGAWVCFDHPDFRGQQFILERGDYPDFYRWNGHNDHMGSCRPVRMVSGLGSSTWPAGGLPAGVIQGSTSLLKTRNRYWEGGDPPSFRNR